jgi:alkanesulfonate monooxygenase SsuD/methylene tetrahydromethanopterin reductase-like flavin-dependent oxidoreductase (luciferase family)
MKWTPPAISIGHYPSSRVEETLAIARELDGGIIDTLWLGDSPLIWRECWTTITLCLARTETLRLGPAVTNPLSRDWTVTASALQTLSEYSPGRIRLGIGLGDSALRRQGGRVARLSELRDAVQAIRSLLTRAALDDRPSLYWDRPKQDIEILVSGSGPKTLALAGELGDGAIIVPGVEDAAVRQVVDRVASSSRDAGREPAEVRIVLWVGCAVGPEDQAWREVAPWVRSVLRHPLAFEISAEVQAAREQIRTSYDFALHMSHDSMPSHSLPVDLLRRFALAGTESRLAEDLHRLTELPVDEIVLVIMGRDPVAQATCLNRLAGAVVAGGALV